MRKTALVFGLVAAAALWPSAQAATVSYKANLAGAAEVPPVQSAGKGTAAVNVDTATKGVSWRVDYSGLSGPAAAAHIHCGAPAGGNAGVAGARGTPPHRNSPLQGNRTQNDAPQQHMQSGQCYVNIHTEAHKGGEIRGQLAP
jgi:hypothetical protein